MFIKYPCKDDYETWIKFFLTGVIETAQEAVEIARSITAIREEGILSNLDNRTRKKVFISVMF